MDDMKKFIEKLRRRLATANLMDNPVRLNGESVLNLMHYLSDCEGSIEQGLLIEAELRAELEKYRWIPITQPPTHHRPVILAQLDNDWMQMGIWAVSGWYDTKAKKWIYPMGDNDYDHYMDCLYDTRFGKTAPPAPECE